MPDFSFHIDGAEPQLHAAAPLVIFKVGLSEAGNAGAPTPIHSIVLRCQLRIEPTRRRYRVSEQELLRDLFGAPDLWGRSLRSMLWTHVSVAVPPFTGSTVVDLPVPCTFDFNVATTKYFAGLADGDVPLCFLFSGTIFYQAEDGALQVTQIPWEKEADYRLPVQVWRAMMDHYYPNTAWLCLRQDLFDRLYQFKVQHSLPTWERALESLLTAAAEVAP